MRIFNKINYTHLYTWLEGPKIIDAQWTKLQNLLKNIVNLEPGTMINKDSSK